MKITSVFMVTNLEEKISKKTGEKYRMIKLLDADGDTTEMFCSADIPNELKKFSKVNADVKINTVDGKVFVTCSKLELIA